MIFKLFARKATPKCFFLNFFSLLSVISGHERSGIDLFKKNDDLFKKYKNFALLCRLEPLSGLNARNVSHIQPPEPVPAFARKSMKKKLWENIVS